MVGRFSSGDTTLSRKPLSPEAETELQNVMRKACERMEWRHLRRRTRKSKSDRALELLEQGIDRPTICERLDISQDSIGSMLRCAMDKRARWAEREADELAEAVGRLADELGANI
jgi:hypothetical protein